MSEKLPKPAAETVHLPQETVGRLKNILTDFDAAFKAILELENQTKPRDQRDLQWQHRLKGELEAAAETLREDEGGPVRVVGGFEGIEGFNRYELLSDGTIRLSAMHTIVPLARVKKLGVLVQDFYDREAFSGPCPCGSGKPFSRCHGVG